jgi:hypothetical protein
MPSGAQSSDGKLWRHVQDRKTPAVYAFDVPLPYDLAALRGEVGVLSPGADRQRDRESRAAAGRRPCFGRAAVRLDDRGDDREPET